MVLAPAPSTVSITATLSLAGSPRQGVFGLPFTIQNLLLPGNFEVELVGEAGFEPATP